MSNDTIGSVLLKFTALVIVLIGVGLILYGTFFQETKSTLTNITLPGSNLSINISPVIVNNTNNSFNNTIAVLKTFRQELNNAENKASKNEWITFKPNNTKCLHGLLVNGVCVRSRGGEEQAQYDDWLTNQTSYNVSQGLPNIYNKSKQYYVYFQENCTTVPDGYLWQYPTIIVNSTHNLTCEQIKQWQVPIW